MMLMMLMMMPILLLIMTTVTFRSFEESSSFDAFMLFLPSIQRSCRNVERLGRSSSLKSAPALMPCERAARWEGNTMGMGDTLQRNKRGLGERKGDGGLLFLIFCFTV